MIKLLIFDLDGTLADTSQDITNALNYALEPYGGRRYSVEETKAMVGSGISNLLGSLIQATAPSARVGKWWVNNEGKDLSAKEIVTSRFLDYYEHHLIDNTTVYPHVRETLSALTRYKKAVLSNKREIYSKRVLEGLDILEHFNLVWGSDSVREKKPSPVPIDDLINKFKISKEQALVIGDSNYDIDAAKAAGVKVIAVTYGFRSIKFLKGADFIIDRFDELLKVIPRIEV